VKPAQLLRFAAVIVPLAVGSWIVLQGSSVSAQTSGADAMKMFDKDNDGSIDLVEAKAAAAALFDKLDANHDGTVTNEELGGRAEVLRQLLPSPNPYMSFSVEGVMPKGAYLSLTETRFKLADPDNDGTLDAKELDGALGQDLLKLLR